MISGHSAKNGLFYFRSMLQKSDEQLLIETGEGLDDAFKELVSRFQDRVYNTCFGFLKSQEDTQEIAQDVFLHIYEKAHTFRSESKAGTWIYRIAVNKSLEYLRWKSREKRSGFFNSISIEDQKNRSNWEHPGIQLENRERATILYSKIELLPENQKTAFVLHKIEGISYKDIAEIMAISLSAVESLMFRAKSNLKKELEKYYLS